MHAFSTLASLALLLASRLALVHASVYVTSPTQSSAWTGGQTYTVSWVDDGQTPLLADIGECTVGLYTGELQLAQSLPSVDVATSSSLSFTPNPASGPDGQYYIVFTASNVNYQGFSASFSLTGMSGTTPGGGSSTPVSTPATTSAGSSTSPGSSTPATVTTTGSVVSTLSGTSSPVVGTTTPTGSTSAVLGTTAATGTTSPTLTSTATATASITTPATTASGTLTSASASASATNAAIRAGSSTSLGGAALFVLLSGILAF